MAALDERCIEGMGAVDKGLRGWGSGSLMGNEIRRRFIGESRGRKIWENGRSNALHYIPTFFVIFSGPLPLSSLLYPLPLSFFKFLYFTLIFRGATYIMVMWVCFSPSPRCSDF